MKIKVTIKNWFTSKTAEYECDEAYYPEHPGDTGMPAIVQSETDIMQERVSAIVRGLEP